MKQQSLLCLGGVTWREELAHGIAEGCGEFRGEARGASAEQGLREGHGLRYRTG